MWHLEIHKDQIEKKGTKRKHQVDNIAEEIGLNRTTQNTQHGEELNKESIKVTNNQAIGIAKYLFVNDVLITDSSTVVKAETGEEIGFQAT